MRAMHVGRGALQGQANNRELGCDRFWDGGRTIATFAIQFSYLSNLDVFRNVFQDRWTISFLGRQL